MTGISFVKGHATGNDFVILPNLDGSIQLTEPRVRALCDRRQGLGADGVLVVSAPDTTGRYFMDHRNADGSMAEMCGNGARLFARYLVDSHLVAPGDFTLDTRGGAVRVTCPGSGDVSITMGQASGAPTGEPTSVSTGERTWAAAAVWAPNPHAVVIVDDVVEAGDLLVAPTIDAEVFPEGVNVEFVAVVSSRHARMRVFERGVGETHSCGTGACAAAWVLRRMYPGSGAPIRIDVPGGTVWVGEHADGQLTLTGPAVQVAQGEIDSRWWLSR
ncbi:MAG: diaminopimelate epimerase [Candidatus Nanopelagicales bacterium]